MVYVETALKNCAAKKIETYPATAAFLHITTGPNWQWSPTIINCFAPITTGTWKKIKSFKKNLYLCSKEGFEF